MASYTVKATYDVTFTRGNLEGLTIEESLPHVDAEHAQAWIDAVSGRDIDGRTYSNFRIHDVNEPAPAGGAVDVRDILGL